MISHRFAAATLLGMSVLSMGHCAPAPQAQVKLLDEFPSAQDTSAVSHGTLVEAVLRSRGGVTDERVQVALGASLSGIEEYRPGALQDYVVQRFVTPTEDTARALEAMDRPVVASQSQGASASRVVEGLWNAAHQKPATRAFLERELGLPEGASDSAFLQALVNRVDDLHHHRPEIKQARQHLLRAADEAADHGVIRVLSAGNQGALHKLLQQLGVVTSADFYASDLADPQAIIVGGADHHGTADRSDDGAAALASPDAGALVGAQAVDVPILVHDQWQLHSGSSFAQPQVANLVATWRQSNPQLTRDEALRQLQILAHPVAGAEGEIGAGIIDWGSGLTRGDR